MNSDSGAFQQSDGNSKKRKEPYMRIFPSVLKKIKSIGSVPKEVVSKIQAVAGEAFNLSSASEEARDRTLVCNALRRNPGFLKVIISRVLNMSATTITKSSRAFLPKLIP